MFSLDLEGKQFADSGRGRFTIMEIFVVCRMNEEAKEESRRKFVKFPFLPIMDQNVHDQHEP